MTDAEKIRALAGYRMEQAADALQAARTLIDAGLPRDAVNRAYYAIFYGVLALLVTRRLGASKHSGALTLFSREFVKKGLLPPRWPGWPAGPSTVVSKPTMRNWSRSLPMRRKIR